MVEVRRSKQEVVAEVRGRQEAATRGEAEVRWRREAVIQKEVAEVKGRPAAES